ncbi:MAG: HNH endonuclease [Mycobacteriales bacterium]
MRVGERTYWRYDGKWHSDNEDLEHDAVHALLVTRSMRQADRVSRAKTIAAQGQLPMPSQRQAILDDVKQLVWHRAGGACQSCGSKTELQFDHIIPVAHGGGNTEANLQILCGPCNRRKSAGLTVRSAASPVTPAVQATREPSGLPPAAWYPDPSGQAGRRYWDGEAWTEHTQV